MVEDAFYKQLKKVELNGVEQWISIRAKSLENPILLFLHGGPGGSEMSSAYIHYGKSQLENNFIVVNWDQRGSGKSYSKTINPNSMTIDQLASDGIELTKILLKEFNKSKLYLVGHSWGSILAIKMIQKDQSMFFSYIGISQLIDMKESEKRSLDIAINLAIEVDNKKAIKELESLKNFDSNKENYLRYMDIHRSWLAKLGGLYYSKKRMNPNMLFLAALFSPEYSVKDVIKLKNGLKFSVKNMWAEIMNINLFNEKAEFDIPMYFIVGKTDNIADPKQVEQYFGLIKAPKKDLICFQYSGHIPQIDEWDNYEKTVINIFK